MYKHGLRLIALDPPSFLETNTIFINLFSLWAVDILNILFFNENFRYGKFSDFTNHRQQVGQFDMQHYSISTPGKFPSSVKALVKLYPWLVLLIVFSSE